MDNMTGTAFDGDEIAAGRITGMLGLTRRAGRLNYGFDAVLEDIAKGKSKAVMLSSDASERTSKKITEACSRFNIKLAVLPVSKSRLGKAIGRIDTAVVSISDKKFAEKIMELVNTSGRQNADNQKAPDGQP